jgi:hypothetical protein
MVCTVINILQGEKMLRENFCFSISIQLIIALIIRSFFTVGRVIDVKDLLNLQMSVKSPHLKFPYYPVL